MPPKRKIVAEAQPSPERKIPKPTTTSTKKRLQDDVVDNFDMKTKKNRRVGQAADVPIPISTVDTPLAVAPRRGRPRKNLVREDTIMSSMEFAAASAQQQTPKLKSGRKSVSTRLPFSSPSTVVYTSPEAKTVVFSMVVEKTPKKATLVNNFVAPKLPLNKPVFVEEEHVLNIWDQIWRAVGITMSIITPVLVTLSLGTYGLGVFMNKSRAIGAVGVSFFMTLCLIFITICIAVIPLIMMCRLFSDLVSSSLDKNAKWAFQRDLRHYTTFVALTIAFTLTSVAYFYKK